MDPPWETARMQSKLFAVQCHQWEPIRNSQLISKYKKIPVQWQIDRYIGTNTQLDTIGRWTPQSSKQRFLPYHYTNYWIYCTYRYWRQMDPPRETARVQSELFAVQCHQWEPIRNSQLIRKYKKIPVQWQIDRYIGTNTQLDTIGRWTPQSSKQRCLPYHYTNYWIYCTYRYRRQMDPPWETARMQSELFAVQCHQWEPIRNGSTYQKI